MESIVLEVTTQQKTWLRGLVRHVLDNYEGKPLSVEGETIRQELQDLNERLERAGKPRECTSPLCPLHRDPRDTNIAILTKPSCIDDTTPSTTNPGED